MILHISAMVTSVFILGSSLKFRMIGLAFADSILGMPVGNYASKKLLEIDGVVDIMKHFVWGGLVLVGVSLFWLRLFKACRTLEFYIKFCNY